MKKIRATLALLLAFMMLLTACGKQENLTETETETAESIAAQGITEADRAFLKTYVADYKAGKYDGKKLFQYERFTEFVTPFNYKGLTYPDDPMIVAEVTDEEVDAYLVLFLLATKVSDDQYRQITDGGVQKYDVVDVDFRGVVDGKDSAAASAKDQSLVIGSDVYSYVPGFESGLIGKKAGEEVRLDLKFSPYCGDADLAGKNVTFYVNIKKIQRPAIPELTTQIINEYYKTQFKTLEEAKAWFKEALLPKEQSAAGSALSAYLQKKIFADLEVVQYPDVELQHYASHFMNYHEQVKGELDWGAYCAEKLGMSYEELQKEAEQYAKEQVRSLLMVYYVAKEEGVTCTAEQMEVFIEGFYTNQNTDGYYGDLKSMVVDCTDLYGANYFEDQLIGAIVSEKIIEYAVKEAV